MIVLGIDPGSAHIGWARLCIGGDPVHGMTATHQASGDFEPAHLDSFAPKLFEDVDVVALEDIAGFAFGKGKGPGVVGHLIAAGKLGERIATIAKSVHGKRVERMTAGQARKLIVGRNNPDNATIKVVVTRLVRAWPTRSNNHRRDAAIVAVAVGWSKPLLRSA